MKLNTNKIYLIIGSIFVIFLIFFGFLLAHVNRYNQELETYKASILQIDEVESILDFQIFHGLDTYVVAKVNLIDNQTFYYFIKDQVVAHYVLTSDLLTENDVLLIAKNQWSETINDFYLSDATKNYTIKLGVLEQQVIYEVSVTFENETHFIVIDAVEGAIILNFSI